MNKKSRVRIREEINIGLISFMFFIVSVISFTNGLDYTDYKVLLVGNSKGEIIKAINEKEAHPMASITKMMTAILVLEEIKKGNIKYDDEVIISKKASKIPYGIKLIEGEGYTVRDLLKATIIRSSNNAAYALGEYLGGEDINVFVKRMNKKAKELKLSSINYCTPHGLPPKYTGSCMDSGNALDIYKLSMEIVKYKGYLDISKKSKDEIDEGNIKLNSTNHLLEKVEGVDGLKTGYHNAAGANIALSAKREKNRVFVIVLGSKKAINRDGIGKREIENYYNSKRVKRKVVDKETLLDIIVFNDKEYGVYLKEDIFDIFYENEEISVDYEFQYDEDAKIQENSIVGKLKVVEIFTKKEYMGDLVVKELK